MAGLPVGVLSSYGEVLETRSVGTNNNRRVRRSPNSRE